jgi:chromosomal replication initiator protein
MNKSTNINNLNGFKSENFDWKLVQSEMKNKLGTDVYESWLKKITFVDEFNNYLLLSVPTRFIRDWITSRYLDQILQIIRFIKKILLELNLKLMIKNNKMKRKLMKNTDRNENVSFIKDSYLQYNRIDPNKRFDNFITGQVISLLMKHH